MGEEKEEVEEKGKAMDWEGRIDDDDEDHLTNDLSGKQIVIALGLEFKSA